MTTNLLELDELSALLRAEVLAAKNFDTALVLASIYGRLHWDNISGFFGDEELERALFEQWKGEFQVSRDPEESDGSWCHLVTRVYASGGHTRLLQLLAMGLDGAGVRQSLLVSQKIAGKFKNNLPQALQNTFVLKGNRAQRARNCFAMATHADVVLMHIHPDDIGTALAARALRHAGKKVLFVNHADHVFSFGHGAADAVLEICATGWRTTNECRSARAQHFMGIPITSETTDISDDRREGPILTIGGPGKYRPSSELDFARFLEKLLDRVPNDVVLVGPSGAEEWWTGLRDRFPNRVHFKGVLPPDVVKGEYQKASCYVDSFPMDGGTVFSEAIIQGVATFGLNRQSSLGISPADEVRCNSEDELLLEVSTYLNGGQFPPRVSLARHRIASEMSTEATVQRVLASAKGEGAELPASLVSLGNRSIYYNAENWKAAGRLLVPKRIWRKLPVWKRLSLMRQVGRMGLSKETARTLKRRMILG